MTDRNEASDDRDARFAERLAFHYRPEPLSPRARARFDAALHARLERPPARPAWLPGLAGVAAALALLWWAWPAPAPEGNALGSAPAALAADARADVEQPGETDWQADVLLTDADSSLDEEEYLPDDYLVIAYALIDGV